ncbi:MAG: ATP-binding protein [Calditrichaceae bacterium]
MIYKDKVLILHKNPIVRERITEYLRETGFAVIVASNTEASYDLTRSMNPDIILWGESLSSQSKAIIRKIQSGSVGSEIPIIALISDLELYDRIEIEKNGISEIASDSGSLVDLKAKIRFHLNNSRRLKRYNREIKGLQNIAELQHNLIITQDLNRLCELYDDFIMNTLRPEFVITLIYNSTTKQYDFKNVIPLNPRETDINKTLFDHPIWQQYFFSNPGIAADRISDQYILNFFVTVGLNPAVFYQFPHRAMERQIGLTLIGVNEKNTLSDMQFDQLANLSTSLAYRILNLRKLFSGRAPQRESTADIQNLFQRLNENEIFNYMSRQLLKQLNANMCIYFNYNEGFRFLYPQYCYTKQNDNNLFENDKPPVLLVKDYPTFEKYLQNKEMNVYYNLSETVAPDLENMASLGGGKYSSIVLFTLKIGNEIKGFFLIGDENPVRKFAGTSIRDAEQLIQKATDVLMESRLIRHAQQTIKQLDRVFELGKELTLEKDINELLTNIASAIRRTLGWNIIVLDRKDPYQGKYETACVFGLQEQAKKKLKEEYPDSMYSVFKDRCFEISNSYFYDHNYDDDRIRPSLSRHFELTIGKEWNDLDWLFIPIQSRGRELGVIAVNDPVERLRPTEDKVRSLEYFANQAAVALENAELYENLKSSELKYRLLAETMTMGLITCNMKGEILYTNKSFAKLLKYRKIENLIGQNILDLCSDKTTAELEKNLLEILNSDGSGSGKTAQISVSGIEIELLDNENEFIPLRIYLTPYYQLSNKVGFLGVLSDQRPQRRLERLKADFNSMIVHDLRSPLNIIQGYIDIVRNQVVGKITTEQEELLTIARENVYKVLKLIDNFLTASKLEAGKFKLQNEVQSLNMLIESAYAQHLVLAENKNIEMKLSLDSKISLMKFDKLRIEQVISNYISNALKFTDMGGKIEIGSKLSKKRNELTGEGETEVQVWVKDHGVGIPVDEQNKVFNKYEQTEAGKDASLKGTGLGLAICKEIISLHKGEVWFNSTPGKGSTFYFSLPIVSLHN